MTESPKLPTMLQFRILGTLMYRYMLSVPPTYHNDPNTKWPAILFLHGAGEAGKDLELAKKHGIPRLIQVYENWRNGTATKDDILNDMRLSEAKIKEKDSSKKPLKPINLDCAKFVAENFTTITPQVDPSNGYGWKPEPLGKLLDEIENAYRIDKERVYVTGMSMGGFGTFRTAMAYPRRFAAIIPICGGGEESKADFIKHLPTWVFHGRKDDVVTIKRSQNMVTALARVGGKVSFTIYPEADHDSWTETYNNMEIYRWLLSHKRV